MNILNMVDSRIQDILSRVEKPSRYLGTEINCVVKNPADTKLHMALAFPDLYEIGTSHFGVQILYHLLNQRDDIAAERVYAPAEDLEAQLRQQEVSLFSLETQTPLDDFDIIGFSLLYELNYTNVLNMLDLASLPMQATQRTEKHPLVIAGGPCVANPEPMADFFDAMVFGDAETVLLQMADAWLAWQNEGGRDREAILRRWAHLEGVYIPRFFKATYDADGFQHLEALQSKDQRVRRAIVGDLEKTPFPDQPIVPFGKPVHDRLRLEVSRGCSRGCRFCQAGMIYRPVRERSARQLIDLAQTSLSTTGYEDLSLLSLSTGDYTCLVPLMEFLMQRCQWDRVAVSLPSVRAGTLSPKLMALIRNVRKTGFTIAPEAGSQRLRDVINKNIRFEDVAETVKDAFSLGWHVIKLYFMIGLPTETDADQDAIVEMVKQLKQIKGPDKRRGKLNVSVSTFIPKSHTPFQWASQISQAESADKIAYLKTQLRIPGVSIKWQNPAMSLLEGVIARGDRRMSAVIKRAWQKGCRFDGWTDRFDFERWRQAFSTCDLDPDFFTVRKRVLNEPLPWDHMDARIDKAFLKEQWREAEQGKVLDDCRHGQCHQCGSCDFDGIEPLLHSDCPVARDGNAIERPPENYMQLELTYYKLDQARYFGHLEMANIFARALRRAKIEVKYSQGFHPKPRISFDDPLPLGMESQSERMRIWVLPEESCQSLRDKVNDQLPVGLRVTQCRPKTDKKRRPAISTPKDTTIDSIRYRITTGGLRVDATQLARFEDRLTWPYERPKDIGKSREVDLKATVRRLQVVDDNTFYLELRQNNTITLRPADILRSIFQLDDETIGSLRVLKLEPR